jgi:hypothetical protein
VKKTKATLKTNDITQRYLSIVNLVGNEDAALLLSFGITMMGRGGTLPTPADITIIINEKTTYP